MKFEHVSHEYDHFTGNKGDNIETVVMETKAFEMSDVLDCFERFLRAIGYSFNGQVGIVDEFNNPVDN